MSERRRAFTDSETLETILLEWSDDNQGWIPSMSAMEGWRSGQLRLYVPTDTLAIITMPDHIKWPYMADIETRDITALLAHPWIRDGAAYEGLREDEIDEFDLWRQSSVPVLSLPPTIPPAHWETAIRPTVSIEEPYISMPLPAVIREENYFLTALLASQLALSVYSATGAAAATTAITALPPPLPRHVAALVVADAKARGSTCPITMESFEDADADPVVTSCGHVFQRAALEHWLNKHSTCPECRQSCSVTPTSAPPTAAIEK